MDSETRCNAVRHALFSPRALCWFTVTLPVAIGCFLRTDVEKIQPPHMLTAYC